MSRLSFASTVSGAVGRHAVANDDEEVLDGVRLPSVHEALAAQRVVAAAGEVLAVAPAAMLRVCGSAALRLGGGVDAEPQRSARWRRLSMQVREGGGPCERDRRDAGGGPESAHARHSSEHRRGESSVGAARRKPLRAALGRDSDAIREDW